MKNDRDKVHLLDILGAAKLAVGHTGNRTKEEFLADIQCQDAVIRRIMIMGEAANRVSVETKAELPLHWGDMVGMRNLLIHEYDDVDMTVVWKTIKEDLPPLIAELEKILPPAKKL